MLLLLFVQASEGALAQDAATIEAQQSAAFVYAENMTFSVQAAANNTLIGAALTVQVKNRQSVYSQAISVTPGTTVSATHTVEAEMLQLPPFARIDYFWSFQDADGNLYRSDQQTVLYEDTYVPWKWERTVRGPITVNTNGLDQIVSRSVLDMATNALAEQSQSLNFTPQHEIFIYVYPDLVQLATSLRLHQLKVQDWVAAYAIPDQHIILISATSGPELVPNLQRDLPHEISHLVVYDVAGGAANVPGWFNEGLALATLSESNPSLNNVLDEAVNDSVLLSVETLCVSNFGGLPPRDAALAYAQSESIVRYIANRYGMSQIRALITAYADGQSCAGAVEYVLGVSLTTLETQWHTELGRSVVDTPGQDMSLAPWIVAWVASLILATLFLSPQPRSPDEESAYDTRVALSSISDSSPDARLEKKP
jgi:hypothetical protein